VPALDLQGVQPESIGRDGAVLRRGGAPRRGGGSPLSAASRELVVAGGEGEGGGGWDSARLRDPARCSARCSARGGRVAGCGRRFSAGPRARVGL